MADNDGRRDEGAWDWILRSGGGDILGCLVFARGVAPERLLEAYGMEQGAGQLLSADAAAAAFRFPVHDENGNVISPVVKAGRSGEWAFVIDEKFLANWLAMHGHHVARHLPPGTETVIVDWTAKPTYNVEYWVDGYRRASFDPQLDDPELFLGRAGLDVEVAERVDFGTPYPMLAALEMLTLALSIQVPEETATGPLLYWRAHPAT